MRAVSALLRTRLVAKSPSVPTSGDAARMSACATGGPKTQRVSPQLLPDGLRATRVAIHRVAAIIIGGIVILNSRGVARFRRE